MIQKYTIIECGNKEDAIKLVNHLHNERLRWCDKTPLKDNSAWEVYKENTSYTLDENGDVMLVPSNLAKKITFSEYCENNEITTDRTFNNVFEEIRNLEISEELMYDLKKLVLKYKM